MSKTYTAQMLAERLGIALNNAYWLMRRDDFPSIRITKRRLIVTEEALENWLREQQSSKKSII